MNFDVGRWGWIFQQVRPHHSIWWDKSFRQQQVSNRAVQAAAGEVQDRLITLCTGIHSFNPKSALQGVILLGIFFSQIKRKWGLERLPLFHNLLLINVPSGIRIQECLDPETAFTYKPALGTGQWEGQAWLWSQSRSRGHGDWALSLISPYCHE